MFFCVLIAILCFIGKPERGIFVVKKYLKEGIETKLKEESTTLSVRILCFFEQTLPYALSGIGIY